MHMSVNADAYLSTRSRRVGEFRGFRHGVVPGPGTLAHASALARRLDMDLPERGHLSRPDGYEIATTPTACQSTAAPGTLGAARVAGLPQPQMNLICS